ncbi:MAG: N-acetyl-gamma-glutamyl-phosphate reductase [Gammaproteobacteria bacterium]|nr:MAG: N-acetyl-gamma-glutamyl-phosphate reductase [Gammaproteobacteria bacterium]
MIKVAIVGATGYTGVELIRILSSHPDVEIDTITSRSDDDFLLSDIYPSLRGIVDKKLRLPDIKNLKNADFIFFATPNGTACRMAEQLLKDGKKIIDLAADFRFDDIKLWNEVYKIPHECPQLLAKSVYGLSEINRLKIKNANLVANPGCYPTATLLGIMPLLEAGLIDTTNIIVDAKSGVSGAGRGANINNLLCEVSENLQAYGVDGHRHLPEIQQEMVKLNNNKKNINLTFIPHLIPLKRGMFVTIYVDLLDKKQKIDLQKLYQKKYNGELFVDILPVGRYPQTKTVTNSNICRISIKQLDSGKIVILSVIDNLTKGAAGQAVQNMNIMCNFSENTALSVAPNIM